MKDIKGYEGVYAITTCGKVWSYRMNAFKKCRVSHGYKVVTLKLNGQTKKLKVHALVAETYLHKAKDKEVVHHVDHNKLNNCVGNLIWLTHSEHRTRHNKENPGAIKSVQQLDKHTGEVLATYKSQKEAFEITGVKKSAISRCCTGHGKYGGFVGGEKYIWRYTP